MPDQLYNIETLVCMILLRAVRDSNNGHKEATEWLQSTGIEWLETMEICKIDPIDVARRKRFRFSRHINRMTT